MNRSECPILDVQHIPGGKTSDYVSHIISSLKEAAHVYGRYVGKSQEDIFFQVKSKITCTLSDRAAVNACVTRQMRDELESHLRQLNCNVHPWTVWQDVPNTTSPSWMRAGRSGALVLE